MSKGAVHEALARKEGEPASQHAALIEFASLGTGRRVTHLCRRLGVCQSTVSKWSKRWDWKVRLAAYDLDMAQAKEVSAAAARTEASEFFIGRVRLMVEGLAALMDDVSTPANVRLSAYVYGLKLAGVSADEHVDGSPDREVVLAYLRQPAAPLPPP